MVFVNHKISTAEELASKLNSVLSVRWEKPNDVHFVDCVIVVDGAVREDGCVWLHDLRVCDGDMGT